MSARNGQDWQHNKSSTACVKVPRLATSQLEQYLREICQDYCKHHKSFHQCLREIARKFATAQKMRGIPATNYQDWHHNKSSTACVQLPRLANNKHFTTILSYRTFFSFFFVSLNFPGDPRSLRTRRKEICDAHVEETNNERERDWQHGMERRPERRRRK
jgi:hypothetical protein